MSARNTEYEAYPDKFLLIESKVGEGATCSLRGYSRVADGGQQRRIAAMPAEVTKSAVSTGRDTARTGRKLGLFGLCTKGPCLQRQGVVVRTGLELTTRPYF